MLEGITSPNTVELLDRGEMDGRPYLVFELIHGTDLRERLRQEGMIAIADALAIAIQVANGLAAAHSRRCVHRDLKPGNILIGDDGRVCVADFGIARALEEPGLTQPGRVLGTGEYVSPEQALGRKVDARSDLYALGVVLYEMLAGRPPFRGTGFADVAARHVRDEPPPIGDSRPNLPTGLAALISALLAKAPEDRPQDAATVRTGLRQILAAHRGARPEPAGRGRAARRRRRRACHRRVRHARRRRPEPPRRAGAVGGRDAVVDELRARRGRSISSRRPTGCPASARENAGPLRWAAVLALGVAVGVIAAAARADDGSGDGDHDAASDARRRGARHDSAPATTTETTADTTHPTATGPAGQPLEVQTALTFDPPPGDGSENDDQAQQAIDGDAATFWETETYRSDPVLSKGGVGLVLALPAACAGGGRRAAHAARPASPPASTRRRSRRRPTRWTAGTSRHRRARSRGPASGSRCAKPARARFILVWITRLAPAEGAGLLGPDRRGHAARIVTYTGSVAAVGDDLAVRGRAAQRMLARLGRAPEGRGAARDRRRDRRAPRRDRSRPTGADLAQGRADGLSRGAARPADARRAADRCAGRRGARDRGAARPVRRGRCRLAAAERPRRRRACACRSAACWWSTRRGRTSPSTSPRCA